MASTPNTSTCSQFDEFAPSTSASGRSYDVFINHRGLDVKKTLATTLYKMLTNGMGLRVFLDSEELEPGDSLPTELQEAMKSASLHIAIFSENYAQSRWCLDELSFMFRTGTRIFPIFYHVKVEDVRYAKEVYTAAFDRHKEKGRCTSEKIKEWKDTLFNVSHNIGCIVNSEEDEEMVLKSVTYSVVKEIKKLPLVVAKHPVGLDEIVEDFKSTALRSDRSLQIVGIWGMGGSGKTTLAKKIYNNIYPSMERASLILDVRDADKTKLLHQKQKKLLDDLGFKDLSVENEEVGKAILASCFRSVRALIVLDDVDHVDQLNSLLPTRESLGFDSLIGSGSLIIITTRELQVLESWSISSIYKMKPLSQIHARQLFCWHAFLQSSAKNGFEELVEKFLQSCSGLPLSLKVLGGQLYGKFRKDHWEAVLVKISRIVPEDIKNTLKISYDALDNEEKEAFLDAACFFIGERSNLAIEVWNELERSGLYRLERLRNKCLLEIDEEDLIRMHDHLRDLAREIASEESPYRLRFPQQTIKVHNEQKRIGIRGIVVSEDSAPGEEFGDPSLHMELTVNTNKGIWTLAPSTLGLKIIVAQGNKLNHIISGASRDLVWLRCYDIEQKNLQSLKNMRVLELSENPETSHPLRELWVAERDAPLQLVELIIYCCHQFQGFPKSIGRLKQLKKIVLNQTGCFESLPEEFCLLESLEHLELQSCYKLSSLPNSMGKLRNLRHLNLKLCRNLGRLSDSCIDLTLLQHLDISWCCKVTLKSDIMDNMSKLEYLNFSSCYQLKELPCNITNQASLRELDMSSMESLREVPMEIGQLSKLRKLSVGGHSLTSLPDSLGDLSSLETLQISRTGVKCLPDSLGDLSSLERLEISGTGVKCLPKSISQLINLKSLQIYNCPVSELDLRAGCKLKWIDLSNNHVLSKISISEDCCADLETITLNDNENLREIEVLRSSLKKLVIRRCPKLSALPSFAELLSLREFVMLGCYYQGKKIEGINDCRELEVLMAETRWEEAGIESLERMERLRTLHLTALRKSGIECCIQSLQKCPGEIVVCTRAVENAAELLNSFLFQSLTVVGSCSGEIVEVFDEQFQVQDRLDVKQPTNGKAIIVCLVTWSPAKNTLCIEIGDETREDVEVEVERGNWVWIGVFTQPSEYYWVSLRNEEGEVDKSKVEGLAAMGEEDKVMETFSQLFGLMAI